MEGQNASHHAGDLLTSFLQSTDEDESQRLLEGLIVEQARPLIRQIIRRKLQASYRASNSAKTYSVEHQDMEDVSSQTVIQLIRMLQELKYNPRGKAILDFQKYVAVVTYHACNEHLRQKHPQRWRLRNRMRYLLTHSPDFVLWENSGEWLCKVSGKWNDNGALPRSGSLQELDNPGASELVGLSSNDLQRLDPAEVVAAILRWAGEPVKLDDLVDIVAGWWGIKDRRAQLESDDQSGADLLDLIPGSDADISVLLERRLQLERLWEQIQDLPGRQRTALLLNLRDERGEGVIELLPLTGVATIRQIAGALEMSDEEFAGLWNRLPLEDTAIAELLGMTRQQVINLRKSARERLARRMKKASDAR